MTEHVECKIVYTQMHTHTQLMWFTISLSSWEYIKFLILYERQIFKNFFKKDTKLNIWLLAPIILNNFILFDIYLLFNILLLLDISYCMLLDFVVISVLKNIWINNLIQASVPVL